MKNLMNKIKDNKKSIIKRSLIVGGTFFGLIMTVGLVKKNVDLNDENADLVELQVTADEAVLKS